MTDRLSDPAAFMEALHAERKLAEMAVAADAAALWEGERCPRLRDFFAALYRRAVGVHPSRRHELAAALEGIKAGGGRRVDDAVAFINRTVPPPSPSEARRPPAPPGP